MDFKHDRSSENVQPSSPDNFFNSISFQFSSCLVTI